VHALFFSRLPSFRDYNKSYYLLFYVDFICFFSKTRALKGSTDARPKQQKNCPVLQSLHPCDPSLPDSEQRALVAQCMWGLDPLSESESDAGWRHPSQIPCASSLHFSGPPKHYHSRVPRLSAAVGSPHCSTPIHQRDASNRPSGPAGSIALLRQEWVVVPRGGGRRVPRDAAARRGPITRRARTSNSNPRRGIVRALVAWACHLAPSDPPIQIRRRWSAPGAGSLDAEYTALIGPG